MGEEGVNKIPGHCGSDRSATTLLIPGLSGAIGLLTSAIIGIPLFFACRGIKPYRFLSAGNGFEQEQANEVLFPAPVPGSQ